MFDRLRYHWAALRLVGTSYPMFLLKEVVSPRRPGGENLQWFSGSGLEIGGSSEFFQSQKFFPIYSTARSLDNVNYSHCTRWEGLLQEGRTFRYDPARDPGHQFICEASDLSAIPSAIYDFVASCHTLEHCANPVKALYEWRRVMRDDGWLALVLPHQSGTFDHFRSVTPFEHMVDDFRRNVTEEDRTHFSDILDHHDLKRDPGQKSRGDFERWILENKVTRGAHHHVFDAALAVRIVDYAGFAVAAADVLMPYHILVIARKSNKTASEKAAALSEILRKCCERSPFAADRRKNLRFAHSQNNACHLDVVENR